MPQRERLRLFLLGLTKFLALVLVAGGVGAALGMLLANVSADDEPPTEVAEGTAAPDGVNPAPVTTATLATTAPALAPVTTTTAPTTTTPPVADPLAGVRLRVLDARLFTDETPSGVREQRARVTVRIRGENAGDTPATLARPILRVGSVRIPTDADADGLAGSQFALLRPGVPQTVTLRFSLAGEATQKVVRDRRARLLIAGQSVAMRIKVRAPAG